MVVQKRLRIANSKTKHEYSGPVIYVQGLDAPRPIGSIAGWITVSSCYTIRVVRVPGVAVDSGTVFERLW